MPSFTTLQNERRPEINKLLVIVNQVNPMTMKSEVGHRRIRKCESPVGFSPGVFTIIIGRSAKGHSESDCAWFIAGDPMHTLGAGPAEDGVCHMLPSLVLSLWNVSLTIVAGPKLVPLCSHLCIRLCFLAHPLREGKCLFCLQEVFRVLYFSGLRYNLLVACITALSTVVCSVLSGSLAPAHPPTYSKGKGARFFRHGSFS